MDFTQNITANSVEDVITLSGDKICEPVTFNWSPNNLYANSSSVATTISSGPYGPLSSNLGIYSTGTTTTAAPWFTSNPTGGKITLNGEGADVEVNGWSLVDAVKRIEERLGLFHPNPELESEWAELRDLAEQYRQLEQHIKDKQATWDRLRAMPAPDID